MLFHGFPSLREYLRTPIRSAVQAAPAILRRTVPLRGHSLLPSPDCRPWTPKCTSSPTRVTSSPASRTYSIGQVFSNSPSVHRTRIANHPPANSWKIISFHSSRPFCHSSRKFPSLPPTFCLGFDPLAPHPCHSPPLTSSSDGSFIRDKDFGVAAEAAAADEGEAAAGERSEYNFTSDSSNSTPTTHTPVTPPSANNHHHSTQKYRQQQQQQHHHHHQEEQQQQQQQQHPQQRPPSMPPLLSLLLLRLQRSFLTFPTPSGWAVTLTLIALASPPLALCGIISNAFSLPHAHLSPPMLLKLFFIPCLAEEVLWRVLMNPHPLELREGAAVAAAGGPATGKYPSSSKPHFFQAQNAEPIASHDPFSGPVGVSGLADVASLNRRHTGYTPGSTTNMASYALLCAVLSTVLYIVAHPLLAYAVRPPALRLFSHPAFLVAVAVLGTICAVAYRVTGSVWAPVLCHWAAVAVWQSLGGRQQAPF